MGSYYRTRNQVNVQQDNDKKHSITLEGNPAFKHRFILEKETISNTITRGQITEYLPMMKTCQDILMIRKKAECVT